MSDVILALIFAVVAGVFFGIAVRPEKTELERRCRVLDDVTAGLARRVAVLLKINADLRRQVDELTPKRGAGGRFLPRHETAS